MIDNNTNKTEVKNTSEEGGDSRQRGKDFFLNKDISVHKEIRLKDRFRILLLRKGLSQNKLSDEVGISSQTISNIINGWWTPTSQIKIRISQVLEVDSLVLFGAEEYWYEWREKLGYPKEKNENN